MIDERIIVKADLSFQNMIMMMMIGGGKKG